jgi:hypothetical protein
MVTHPCGQPKCRAYQLTVGEFERLGGEPWTQSFRIRVGLLASKLYVELYGKKPKKVRSRTNPPWRNEVVAYPCGILEQAYRELRGKAVGAAKPVEAHNASARVITPTLDG